ncbi:helix-turn-helix domain-containing protein [Streptomyces sp. NPDC006514]|uniref:helix-turn-helix domain-containing protein n=1 Tax=Streptomyces sp. NPDC006514 TaxID=3154308 RepID=UPI0033BA851E
MAGHLEGGDGAEAQGAALGDEHPVQGDVVGAGAGAAQADGVPDLVDPVRGARDEEGPQPRLSLTEVVRRSGIPRSSAHRILDQLVQWRWLDREGRDYRMGMRMLELGALAPTTAGCAGPPSPCCTHCTSRTGNWCTCRCWTGRGRGLGVLLPGRARTGPAGTGRTDLRAGPVWRELYGPGRAGRAAAARLQDPRPKVSEQEMDNMMGWLRFSEWM